jgi:hypothetical protein
MLEQTLLWLSSPTTAWPPGLPRTARWLRHVLAGHSREPLGHFAISPLGWWPWSGRPRLGAYEIPDSSLLFTARRSGWLWPVTRVRDADGNAIAVFYGQTLASGPHRFLAKSNSGSDWRSGQFVARGRSTVMQWQPDGGGLLLHFLPELRHEPFVKMGMLAAIAMLD